MKLIGLLFLALSFNLSAATLDGVSFADKVSVEGRELVLNGIGIRKATFLSIRVYYGALYLDKKAKDPNNFLGTTAPKQIIMHFIREVEAKKLRDAFSEGLVSANENYASFKEQMDQFNSYLVDVDKGDEFIISFLNDGVLLKVNGKTQKILGGEFARALLSIWFIKPRDEGLRAGLLGLN